MDKLNQAKDEIAKELGYVSWKHIFQKIGHMKMY